MNSKTEVISSTASEKTLMEKIREGLLVTHAPGEENRDFVDAVYELFKEYVDDYKTTEWPRLDENYNVYTGNHWESDEKNGYEDSNPNAPKPSTPIIMSTIENIKADLSDEFPEAIISPDSDGTEVAARVLTTVISEELDVCGWAEDYYKILQDMLCDGWSAIEVGHNPDSNNGFGGTYLYHVINKNFMCDPQVIDLQEGRAVFKFDRRPYDWFKQHYPEHEKFMKGDDDLIDSDHDHFSSTTEPNNKHSYRLIEAWFRVYDSEAKRYRIHFCKVAGGQVLENSCDTRPDGYYAHGAYPFVICRLFPQKGNALGLGISDLFKGTQKLSDKLDQIMMMNAFRSSHNRLIVQDGAFVNDDDARDFSKEVIFVQGDPNSCVRWMETKPLPSYLANYIFEKRQSIKNEAGANDQSRGQTGGGVTAGSAITALQDMSTKRSRMEAQCIHIAFKKAIRMMIEVLREFSIVPRDVAITIQGEKQVVSFTKDNLGFLFDKDKALPVEHYINIKTSRQTRYSRMQKNELWLQMLNTLSGTVDPAIMMEGLDYDGKEELLENIRRAQASGMTALQQQVAQLTQMCNAQQSELNEYRASMGQAQAALAQQRRMMGDATPMPETSANASQLAEAM